MKIHIPPSPVLRLRLFALSDDHDKHRDDAPLARSARLVHTLHDFASGVSTKRWVLHRLPSMSAIESNDLTAL